MNAGRPSRRGLCLPGLAVAACALLAGAAPAPAQDGGPAERPISAQRIVRHFDFEELSTNPFPIPRYWVRAQEDREVPRVRPGFPIWNEAAIDAAQAHRGHASVRLPTRGGSTSLLLDPGVVPVFAGADYLVSAMVRTEGLTHARAMLAARLLDRAGRPIADSEQRSELLQTGGRWRPVSVHLTGDHPDAAYLQLELLLLQPREFAAPTLPEQHQLWPEDISGAAWFDDVLVAQLPSVMLSTNSPVNVVAAPDAPEINLRTRDFTGEPLRAVMIVQDLDGREIARAERAIGAGAGEWLWKPDLPAFGWYRATLELFGPAARVGSTSIDFVWTPPARALTAAADAARFGVVLERPDCAHAALIPGLAALAGAGWATIPAWDRSLVASKPDDLLEPILAAVDGLLAAGRRVTLSFPEAPAALVNAADGVDRPLALVAGDRKRWGPYLLPLLDKYGQSVQRWQFGRPTADPHDPVPAAAELAAVRSTLARFVPGPLLAIPFPADAALDTAALGASAGGVAVVPAAFPPESFKDLAASLGRGGESTPADLTLTFEPLSDEAYGRRDIAGDLVKRTVHFWSAFAGESMADEPARVAIAQPWRWDSRRRNQASPRVELAVWRTLAEQLAGRRVVGEVPTVQGVRCFILAPAPDAPPGRTGALVAWRETAPPEAAVIDAFGGEGTVTAADPFGNVRTLRPDSAAGMNERAYRVRVTDTPVFIEGVDVGVARFRAAFRLEPSFAPSDGRAHEHQVVLENPWGVRIEGSLTIVEPGGYNAGASAPRDRSWKILPRTVPFAIEPGAVVRLPVSITFSAVEEAGIKDLIAVADVFADRDYKDLRLRTPLEVGHESLQLDLVWRTVQGRGGREVLVEAHVTNKSDTPATLEVGAFAPGSPRARASISDLPPGSSVVRRFPFPNAESLRGHRISVSIEDIDTNARLTRSVLIE